MDIIKQDEPPLSKIAHELIGADHGLDIHLLFVDAPPSAAAALHRHPYARVCSSSRRVRRPSRSTVRSRGVRAVFSWRTPTAPVCRSGDKRPASSRSTST